MILDNLDEIYQEVLEELSYRVGVVNLKDAYHFALFTELVEQSELSEYTDLVIESLCEADDAGKIMVKNIKSGNIYPIDKSGFKSKIHQRASSADIEKAQAKETQPKKLEKSPSQQDNGYKGKKNKSLKKGDPTKTDEFNKGLLPSDIDFEKRNKKYANPIPPQPYKLPENIIKNAKFPKKYVSALERMMNTKPTGDGTKWTHYSDIPGGQGQISAQAGELMSMMGVTMNDDEFEEFTNSLLQHESELIKNNENLKTEGSRIVTKSWITASKNNRTAILNRIKTQYPNSTIMASAWDTKDDVEAIGLSEYNANKGFSTDVYFKIKKENGEEILDEVSLKKSSEVNFLNSGAGKFMEWDDNLPDEINQNVYKENQRQRLVKYGNIFKKDIENLLSKDDRTSKLLKNVFESKNISFEDALVDLEKGKGSRGKTKVILECIKALANDGNKDALSYLKTNDELHREFQTKAILAITENPKMKAGMLNEIRSEFPLKAISDGEETMAIGINSLDKPIMKSIFGTDDFDEIKEKLTAESGPPPFLGYKANIGSKIIPLAKIEIREDGVGYGGNIKFEMKLDARFAKVLAKANLQIYT
jgi:hypothetical protein